MASKKAVKVISPSGLKDPANGFKGWSFWEFLKGYFNIIKPTAVATILKTLKELVKFAVPAFISFATTNGNALLVTLATVFGKGILDLLDYWLQEKTA